MTHRLLERQLRKLRLDRAAPPNDPAAWSSFLEAIARAYEQADQDRYIQERSLAISSEEMQILYRRITDERETIRAVLDSLGEGGCALDAAGRLLLMNPGAERLLGWSEAELVGQPILERIEAEPGSPTEGGALPPRLSELSTSGGPAQDFEAWLRRKDGSRFLAEFRWRPMRQQDPPKGAVMAFRDLTAIREAETQLRQFQRLESVGQLAGGIAHDFNNILAVILSYTDVVMQDLDDRYDLREDLSVVRSAALKGAELTRKLLVFGRREITRPAPLRLNAVVQDIAKLLGRTLGENNRLVLDLAGDLRWISADGSLVEQIIMNLALNARDAMPQGGRITITTSNMELATELAGVGRTVPIGSYVVLSVSDTGTGMSAAVAERVFEPFFTTKPTGKGTGLGLATVYGAVNQSGGHIRLVTEPGVGTSFWVYLPACDDDHDDDVEAVSLSPRHLSRGIGGETVLVVEDEPTLRHITLRALRDQGYKPIAAENGKRALEASLAHPGVIDLVLTDVVMPEMSGRDLVVELVRQRPAIKVLYVSGYPDDVLGRHGVLSAGLHLLQKPYTMQELLRRVRDVLDYCGSRPPPRSVRA